MYKEMIEFARKNNLNPFNKQKTQLKIKENSIYKTKDARYIHQKTLNKLSEKFVFVETSNLFKVFHFTEDFKEIKKRQDFFKNINSTNNEFLKQLNTPKQTWKPKYSIVVVTEDETTFSNLKKLDCPVLYLNSQYDLENLENYDIIQILDCEKFTEYLESLPQSIFIHSIEEVYLERYLIQLSSWKNNLLILSKNDSNQEIKNILQELLPLLDLIEEGHLKILKKEDVENSLEIINSEIEKKIKDTSISGITLLTILSKGKIPDDLQDIIKTEIKKTNIPENIFNITIPVTLDEKELERFIKINSTNENINIAEKIKKHSKELKKVPELLNSLSYNLLVFDFLSGIMQNIKDKEFPIISEEFSFVESENIFLDKPDPITFYLSENNRCSILTGANSGGKTTLLEHIIQLITIFQLGLPKKNLKIPLFTDVYYFAKSKGVAGKGAFESLLNQMDKIKTGKKTLILADEIEAVTEPGIAGKIISATAEFFIKKGCFLVIATHLGEQIQKSMPEFARIDGIEAKGLNEFYELIVDHNPILGKIASSTPELIIEKLASTNKTDYFKFLSEKIKKKEND
ncbi:MAG: hypothetical protein QXW97_02325 [Candidatus Pacearchaeota archaeon]